MDYLAKQEFLYNNENVNVHKFYGILSCNLEVQNDRGLEKCVSKETACLKLSKTNKKQRNPQTNKQQEQGNGEGKKSRKNRDQYLWGENRHM